MLHLIRLQGLLATLGLWMMLCASALASGGADCTGYGHQDAGLHASSRSALPSDTSAQRSATVLASAPPLALITTAHDQGSPSTTEANDGCGSCVLCSACCVSAAPPLSLTPKVWLPSISAMFSYAVRMHPSPDLAALERPPQAA